MANCRFIDRLGITEQEFLQETKGEYSTSFFISTPKVILILIYQK